MEYLKEMFLLAKDGETQGVLFWAAVYAFVVMGYSLYKQIQTRTWPSTIGTLTEKKVVRFGAPEWDKSDQDYIAKALYTYEVNGQTYHGKRVSTWVVVASHNARFVLEKQMKSIEHLGDGKVKVYYNPKKPQKSFLIIAGKFGILVSALICIGPLILYFKRFHF